MNARKSNASGLCAFVHTQAISLRVQLERLIQHRGDPPPADDVHRMRVAIRRFREAVLISRDVCGRQQSSGVATKVLKEIMQRAGAVRDCDVALRLLEESDMETEEGTAGLRDLRATRAAALSEAMRRFQPLGTDASVRKGFAGSRPQKKLRAELTAVLVARGREFLKRGKRAAGSKGSTRLHRFRIAVKQFRYSIELFEESFPIRAWIQEVRAFQNVLGELNDCKAVRKLIRARSRGRHTSEFARVLRERQKHKTHAFGQMWEENFGKAAQRRHWLKKLKRAIGEN